MKGQDSLSIPSSKQTNKKKPVDTEKIGIHGLQLKNPYLTPPFWAICSFESIFALFEALIRGQRFNGSCTKKPAVTAFQGTKNYHQ
jgi:hypothetical protein